MRSFFLVLIAAIAAMELEDAKARYPRNFNEQWDINKQWDNSESSSEFECQITIASEDGKINDVKILPRQNSACGMVAESELHGEKSDDTYIRKSSLKLTKKESFEVELESVEIELMEENSQTEILDVKTEITEESEKDANTGSFDVVKENKRFAPLARSRGQTRILFWIRLLFWILVQIGIVLAKFNVPKWEVWFGFMQALHLVDLFVYVASRSDYNRSKRKVSWLQIIVPVLSYHSVTGFLLTGDLLLHVTIWPWIIFIVLMILRWAKGNFTPKRFEDRIN